MARLKTLRRFETAFEAESARVRLEAAGIPANVQGSETATMLSYIGPAVAAPSIEVVEEDYERARQVLEADRRAAAQRSRWKCPGCSEANEPGFDLCWKCSTPYDESWEPVADEAPMTQPTAAAGAGDDRNPWRPLSMPAARSESFDEVDDAVGKRAFFAAVIGLVVPITLLSFYSLYLLAAYPPSDRPSEIWARPAAWLINVATVAVVFTYYSMFVQ